MRKTIMRTMAIIALSSPALAQDREPWTITLMLENDSFLGIDDRHYTNGLYAAATSGTGASTGVVARPATVDPGGPSRKAARNASRASGAASGRSAGTGRPAARRSASCVAV